MATRGCSCPIPSPRCARRCPLWPHAAATTRLRVGTGVLHKTSAIPSALWRREAAYDRVLSRRPGSSSVLGDGHMQYEYEKGGDSPAIPAATRVSSGWAGGRPPQRHVEGESVPLEGRHIE